MAAGHGVESVRDKQSSARLSDPGKVLQGVRRPEYAVSTIEPFATGKGKENDQGNNRPGSQDGEHQRLARRETEGREPGPGRSSQVKAGRYATALSAAPRPVATDVNAVGLPGKR